MLQKESNSERLNATGAEQADISKDRKRILKSRGLHNAIINSTNFMSIATDDKGTIQIFNIGAESMLGYASIDMVDKLTLTSISDTEELVLRAKALSAEFDTVIKPGFEALVYKASRGIEDIYDLTYIGKDGSRLPTAVSVTALHDVQNTLIGYLLIGTDNTARKQVELKKNRLDQQLLDQQLYTQSLIESISDALMAIDPSGNITDANRQMVLLTGCTRAELLGTPFKNCFTDSKRAEAGLKQVLSEKSISDYELTIRCKNGKETTVSFNASTFYDREQKLQGVFAAARDVTAQKQASLYARSLIEAALDPLVTISPAGKITDVNKATVKVTGVKREDLINTDFSDYFTEPDKARAGYEKVFSDGLVRDYPLTINHKDGQLIDVLYNASVYKDDKGDVLGVFAAARDVTDSNRLTTMLEENNTKLELATAAAEKANLAKSEFLFSMSHELRTPLNAILGFAQLMEIDEPPPSPDQKENIEQILKSGWHLLTLINEVLDLAKIESGEVPLSQEPVSLASVMLECQSMIEPQLQEAGISISFPSPDMDYYVQADQTRVKQVLINLLSNAIKYNSEQGSVEVTCTESTPGRIRVSVKDTGAGLSPEDQGQLFQAFNRLGKEAGSEEGTGIGLVVSKSLIEIMEGSIGLESSVGVGSVFWFELPAVNEPQLTKEDVEVVVENQKEQAAHLARPYNLLYIEDNPANMKLFEKIIARYPNIQLQTAVNGTIGTAHALKYLPDVIVTDIDMPDISGFDVLKSLRSNPSTAHIPIIALSANAMPREVERGIKAGFFRYLTKPIKIDEFMKTQDEVLEFLEEQANKKK